MKGVRLGLVGRRVRVCNLLLLVIKLLYAVTVSLPALKLLNADLLARCLEVFPTAFCKIVLDSDLLYLFLLLLLMLSLCRGYW
jgi:hypothetical protein